MNKFKIGEIITGNEKSNSKYAVTNSFSKLLVINNSEDEEFDIIRVKVLKHKSRKNDIGEEFWVNPIYFRRTKNKIKKL